MLFLLLYNGTLCEGKGMLYDPFASLAYSTLAASRNVGFLEPEMWFTAMQVS